MMGPPPVAERPQCPSALRTKRKKGGVKEGGRQEERRKRRIKEEEEGRKGRRRKEEEEKIKRPRRGTAARGTAVSRFEGALHEVLTGFEPACRPGRPEALC